MLDVNHFVVVYCYRQNKFECDKLIKNCNGCDGFVCNQCSKDCPNCKYHGYDKNAELKPVSDDEGEEMFGGNTSDDDDIVQID